MKEPLTTRWTTRVIVTAMLLLLAGNAGAGEPVVTEQFDALDVNRDGVVTESELKAQPERIRYMHLYSDGSFGLADVNSDGQLDEAEFAAFEEEIPAE